MAGSYIQLSWDRGPLTLPVSLIRSPRSAGSSRKCCPGLRAGRGCRHVHMLRSHAGVLHQPRKPPGAGCSTGCFSRRDDGERSASILKAELSMESI